MKDFIHIKGLSKKFGGFVAVDNVDLDIEKGELFSILGGSGCGKTTLLRMLAGFEIPTSGSIEIDGVDITRLAPYDRPVNMMFQSYAIFPHMNVAKNIAYGLRKDGVGKAEIEKRVDQMLELVQLSELKKRKPDQLSGGQRQRVAIGRALLKNAPILILDEATSSLDTKSERRIQEALETLMANRTTLVIAHRLSTVENADQIIVLDAGKIVESGTHAELVAQEGHYAALYRMQFSDA